MTTNSELYALAEKHRENKTIACMISAIDEAKAAQDSNWYAIKGAVELCRYSKTVEKYYTSTSCTMLSHAIEHAKATAKLQTLFFTLACQLEGLGEDIIY